MKIYLIDYNVDERENKKIYVSQYSSYKIGINVNGVDNSRIQLTKNSDETLIPSEGDFKGYNTYSFEAGTPETNTLNIWFPYLDGGLTFHLQVITTDSTVAELSSGSGGSTEIPEDLELLSLNVGGEGSSNVIRAEPNLLYLKGQDLKVTVEDYYDVIRIDDDLYDPNSWEQYKGVRVNCDEIQVNKKIDCSMGLIAYNDLTGNYLAGNSGSFYNSFSSPGFSTYQDEWYKTKIDMNANITMRDENGGVNNGGSEIILGEYDEHITGERKNGLALNNVTQMIFRDSSGSPLTVVPIQITDGNGMMYTVLGVQAGV